MIDIRNLSKTFGELKAVNQVSFRAEKGEICGVLGPNGAGKSTLFKMLMGLLQPDDGEIIIGQKPVVYGDSSYKRKIGFSPEAPVFYEYLTAAQFLDFISAARRVPPEIREDEIKKWVTFFNLDAKVDDLVKNCSHGMRRKISLIAALVGEPPILILDEATNGLDPESSFRFKTYLREYAEKGGTALFSTHIIEVVEHLCDRILVMGRGRIIKTLRKEEWLSLRKHGGSLEQEFIQWVKNDDESELS